MPECYEFEECEYNGQPRCYLPDGVDCPHGVDAGANEGEHLMDIEKLIKRIKCPQIHSCPEVNAALQEHIAENKKLHAENEKLRAELEQVKRERDAAVSDIETIMAYGGGTCQFCGNGHCYARGGKKPCLPKWRGRKAE